MASYFGVWCCEIVARHLVVCNTFQADCLQPLCCVCLSVLFLLSNASYDQWDGRVAAAEQLKQTLYGYVHHAFPTVSGGSELWWQHPIAEATI